MLEKSDEYFMREALKLAERAFAENEVPVGAVIVRDGVIIGKGYNQREMLNDPTAHAEMIAITSAATAVEDWRLNDCTLYVTLEPCLMCAGAIVLARIGRIVYGADDPKAGAVRSLYNVLEDKRLNHHPAITFGILAQQSSVLLKDFFQKQRMMGKK